MLNFQYFIQPFIYPLTSMQNFKPVFLKDLQITDNDKRYILNFIILNVFFESYDDLWKNLGMSYFTVRNYFESNPDFIIVKDSDRSLYLKARTFINRSIKKNKDLSFFRLCGGWQYF